MSYEANGQVFGIFTAANANIERFRFVQNTGTTVALATAAQGVLGVCLLDDPVSGQAVPVQYSGIAMVEVGSAGVTANGDVEVGTNGTVVDYSAGVKVGKALKTAAAGEITPILLKTGY